MDALPDLHLPLKREYFDVIRDGHKLEEYRLCTPYWAKRIENKNFGQIVLTLAYPAKDDHNRRLVRRWCGYTVKENFVHPHFGPKPVTVFAINVEQLV